jgi:hypothetical protein
MTSQHELTQNVHHQPERLNPDGESRAGWRRHGIPAVAGQDSRLSWSERELGVKLYDEQLESSE